MPTELTHDYTLEDVDASNKTGFMSTKRRNRTRDINIEDAQTIQPRVLSMGDLTESESPAELRIYWSQKDWRRGIGGTNSLEEPQSLHGDTRFIDTSLDGKIKISRATQQPSLDLSPTQSSPSGFALVNNDELWAFIGREPYKWDESNNEWDKGTAPAATDTIYRNGVPFGSNTFAPGWVRSNGAPDQYIYKDACDCDWQLIDSCNSPDAFKYFAKGRNVDDEEILVGGYTGSGVHHIHTSTDPTDTANWSAAIAVGSSDSPIVGLLTGPDNEIVILKTNGIWTFSRSGVVRNITPEYEFTPHPDNFKGAFNWNGHIILPLGIGGMLDFVGGQLFNISLSEYMPDNTEFHGPVVAVHGTPTNLFVMVWDEPNNSFYILMAEFVKVGDEGTEDFNWHHVATFDLGCGITINDYNSLFAESTELSGGEIHRRLWISAYDTVSNTTPMFFPLYLDDQDTYNTGTNTPLAYTSIDARGFTRIDKNFASIDFVTENLGGGGRQFTVAYSIDGGAWTTDLEDAAGNGDGVLDVSPTQTLTFPNGTSGKEIRFRLTGAVSGTGATSPIVSEFRLVAQLRPDALKLFPIKFYIADKQRLKNGAYGSNAKAALAQLRTWDGQAAEVVLKYDEGLGAGVQTKNVVFLPGTMKVTRIRHGKGRRPEYIVEAILAEI